MRDLAVASVLSALIVLLIITVPTRIRRGEWEYDEE